MTEPDPLDLSREQVSAVIYPRPHLFALGVQAQFSGRSSNVSLAVARAVPAETLRSRAQVLRAGTPYSVRDESLGELPLLVGRRLSAPRRSPNDRQRCPFPLPPLDLTAFYSSLQRQRSELTPMEFCASALAY